MGEPQKKERRLRTTRIQINALVALIVLATMGGGLMFMLALNNLTAHQFTTLSHLLGLVVGATVYVVKHFATTDED